MNIKKGRLKLQEVISENVFKNLRVNFEKVMNLVSIVLVRIIVSLFLSKIVLDCISVFASNAIEMYRFWDLMVPIRYF